MKFCEWIIPRAAAEIPPQLTDIGYPPLLSALLNQRGICTPEEAERFLFSGPELLGDPMLLADMDKAVARVGAAIINKETVVVFGDYDVDGITSVCLVKSYLRDLGVPCSVYIPDRIGEGYGLNKSAIDVIADRGATLIITVDCGITAVEEAGYAKSLGIDMVITDHHECISAALPAACAVVDPKRPDCPYPYKELAGVGVALKLLCAVEGDCERVISQYADLVAAGTVADVMPLTGENRYIVKRGIEMLSVSSRPGMRALLVEAGVAGKPLTATTVSFTIAPRINAAGRLGKAEVAVQLLMTDDEEEATLLASELCRLNRERQSLEQVIWEEARAKLDKELPDAPIVLVSDNWHQGVIGIAASKLADEYALPTVMICLDGETGKGSCRSSGDFNLFAALAACSDYLVSFGGHALAAGLTIKRDRVDDFRAALANYYQRNPATGSAALRCDMRIENPDLLSMEAIASLELMEPYGAGNPRPTYYMTYALMEKVTPIGGGKHLRINLRKGRRNFECVLFSCTLEKLGISEGERVDIAFYPKINDFRGRKLVQFHLADVRRTDLLSLCRELLNRDRIHSWEAAEHCPSRGDFVKVWRWLEFNGGRVGGPAEELLEHTPPGICAARLLLCLKVMEGENLVSLFWDGENYEAQAVSRQGKADLESSVLWKELKECRDRY